MKFKLKSSFIALLASGLLGYSSMAFANGGTFAPTPVVKDSDCHHWMVRLRALWVHPYISSSELDIIGGSVTHASSQFVPELDISYYFTPHFASELILATSRHSVTASGTGLGDVNLGHVSLLPPTLTFQYHFLPHYLINPYVGAGINYTYFYRVDHGPVATNIDYSNSFGPALQAGVDVALNSNWSVNFDVKKIFIDPTVHVTALGHVLETKVKIDPVVMGIGLGYRFA